MTPDERAALVAALAVPRLQDAGLEIRHGAAGRTAEVPPAHHPVLAAVLGRLETLVGLRSALPPSFRVRHAAPGDAHPLHLDAYDVGEARLVATALLCLDAGTIVGGETVFPRAEPPLCLALVPGGLALWFNHRPDGAEEPASTHALERVLAGHPLTANIFFYAHPDQMRAAGGLAGSLGATAAWGAPRPVLTCIDDTAAPESAASLARACAARGVVFQHRFASEVDPREPPLEPGGMLSCVSTSAAAERVERQLWQPGVASFHRGPEGPFNVCVDPLRRLARAGLPVPRALTPNTPDPAHLADLARHLGGFPIVVKIPGGEGGIGTLRADSLPALCSLFDLLRARGLTPTFMAYVPDAVHWRIVVVGDRAVAAYLNPVAPGDFRSRPSGDAEDYGLEAPPDLAAVAVEATRVLGVAFAGVDVLVHPSGRAYLLEANSPCYFPQAEAFGSVNVAGAMVEHLLILRRSISQ